MKSFNKKILDSDGYPTEAFLKWIKSLKYDVDIYELIDIIEYAWYLRDWGFIKRKSRNKKFTLELHTAGWSGNEDIINALKYTWLWFYWMKSYRGGHYYFSIPVENKLSQSEQIKETQQLENE